MITFVDRQTYCEVSFCTSAGSNITSSVSYQVGWGNTFDEMKNKITTIDEARKAANQTIWCEFYSKPIPKIPVTKL